MRRRRGFLFWAVVAVAVGFLGLGLFPPALLRVGNGYAAKAVCSHHFVAGRPVEEILRVDVQAPGHPLLHLVSVDVHEDGGAVMAAFPGGIAVRVAVARDGLGCAVVPRQRMDMARDIGLPAWPAGAGDGPGLVTALDPQVAALLDDQETVGPGMRAVVVVHRGRVVAERYGDHASPDVPLQGWSMTKTVTAALVGVRIGEGALGLERSGLFADWDGDGRARITVAHLLAMSSGLRFDERYGHVTDVTRMLYLEPDMASFAAARPLAVQPGTRFHYSSGDSVLLSRVLMDTFPDTAEALAWPRQALFVPLGMTSAVLEADAYGTPVGSSYMYATARDWARFGQLLLQDGRWQGEQILPAGFVSWMRSPVEASGGRYGRGSLWLHGPRDGDPPGVMPDQGFDLPADTYWLLGHDGQSMAVVPGRELVVLRLGLTPAWLGYKPQGLLAAVLARLAEETAGAPAARDR